MSATATTTLSDTLVVGRQPQQSVGVVRPFCSPSPSTSSFSNLRLFLAFSPPPCWSNGLDPQFTSANRPSGVRFPREGIRTHPSSDLGHHHPQSAACVLGRVLGGGEPRFLVCWDRMLRVVVVRRMWKGRSIGRIAEPSGPVWVWWRGEIVDQDK